tara:strand:+ start:953 stop:1336 length:384 start_codon:yes stop_codon:yes gene_type:complete
MIIEEIPFFVEFVLLGIVLGFGYGFTKLFLNHAKDKNKIIRKERKAETDNKLENELDKYLDNAPAIIQHLEAEIANLKEKGSTPEQTQRLESELSQAKALQKYEPIIRIAGKPLLKKAMSLLDNFKV